MSSWEDIAKRRLALIEESQQKLQVRIRTLQNALFQSLLDVLLDLDTEQGGVKETARNYAKVRTINLVFDSFKRELTTDKKKDGRVVRLSLTSWIAKQVREILGLNQLYIKEVKNYAGLDRTQRKATALIMQQIGLNKNNKIVKGSWLDNLTSSTETKINVINRVNQAISGGMDLKTFQKQFKADFTGKNGIGTLEKHWNTVTTRTLFASVDRKISDEHRKKARLQFFIYAGGVVEATRPFCAKKANVIFHDSIFEKWETQNWQGKIEGASVRNNLGGYNCQHAANYITDNLAKRLIERGRKHEIPQEILNKLYE